MPSLGGIPGFLGLFFVGFSLVEICWLAGSTTRMVGTSQGVEGRKILKIGFAHKKNVQS